MKPTMDDTQTTDKPSSIDYHQPKCETCETPLKALELLRDSWRRKNGLKPMNICKACDDDFHNYYV